MKNLLCLLTLFCTCSLFLPVIGQVELKLQLQPDGVTYTTFSRSQTDLLPPVSNITHSGQIIIVVPTGSFEVEDLVSHAGQWKVSNFIQHPTENPSVDYVMFSLEAPTSEVVYEQGQESPLFSFKNKNGCVGALEIMDPADDPFLPPNSLNLTMRTEMIVEGVGAANAVVGIYGQGEADCFRLSKCLIVNELELLPDNFYQISFVVDSAFIAPANLKMLQVAVKVPTNFFQVKNLTNLLSGQFSFGNTTRFDSPAEDDDHDYIQFRLNATGLGLALQPGEKYPVLKFANGGSCQGDSIFLIKNDDPFLPPNSQAANFGPTVKFFGSDASVALCHGSQFAAPCVGCLFTDGLVKLDSVQHADPVVCLGGSNGMLKLFAQGSSDIQYSIDGGQSWFGDGYFPGLPAGSYQPQVRGTKFGCPVGAIGQPVELEAATTIDLQLETPAEVCQGSDVALKITSPNPLPANANFAWSGPQGFSQSFADPILLNVNNYQSGTYSLLLTAPGCDPATASAHLQVNALPASPDILSNGPICFGEKLQVFSNASGSKFEWYSPLGASGLSLPDLTTTASATFIEPTSQAYLSGNWQVKVTDTNGCTAMSQPLGINIKPRPQAFAETTGPVCPGGQAQLLSNPLPGATYEWKVQGESTIFSMQPNPLINNVLAPQTYQLVVWQDGCVSIVPAIATVSLNPLPSLSPVQQYTPAADCSPKPLTLTANANGTGLNYLWNGPNGFSSQAANPVIPAANAAANGSYTLQVTNVFGCSATQSVLVSVIPDPVAMPIVQSTGPACPGDDVELSAQTYSGSQVSYQWYKSNTPLAGQTSNTLVFNAIQPNSEGNYKLRVAVNSCIVESAYQFLDVLDPPQPNPDFFLSQPCEGGTLQFFSNINGIADWHWTGPAGFVSDSPTPVIYQTQLGSIGAYQLTVTGTNGCEASASLLIDGILPVPAAPVVASNSPVCPGAEIQLTVQNPSSNGGNVNYFWQNANGEPVGASSPTLTLSATDPLAVPPFLVKTVVNTCPSPLSNPVPVQVLPAPTALAWNGGAVCAGAMAQLFAATQPNVSYEWQVAGQVVSIEQNPALLLSDTTDFQLVVKTNGCAATAVATTQVPVNPVPVIANLSANAVVCEGSPVNLTASNTVPLNTPVQYAWAGPNGFSFTGSAASAGPFPLAFASVSAQNEGSYTLTLTSAEGCVSAPQSVAVEVGSMPPTPTMTVADAQLCEGETLQLDATPANGASVSYDWFFNDGASDTFLATTSFPTYLLASVTPSNTGSYFVKTTADGCQTQASNLVPLTVLDLPTAVSATNPTTSLTPACEGTNVQLSATLLPGANYHWYGPAGFYANVPNPVLSSVETAQSGDFLVVVGYPACSITLAAETSVFVTETPETPILSGAATACEGTDAQLMVANPETGAAYDFYFGQNGQPFLSGSILALLQNVDASFTGNYFAAATVNGCSSTLSSAFAFQVIPAQTGIAFAGDDQTLCEANKIPLLQATPPAVGAGFWTSLDGATVVQPNSAHSTAIGLVPGQNRFVWTLTNGLCPGVGSDTVAVFLENIKAVEDFYSLPLNDSLLNINLLANDFTQNVPDWEFMVLTKPTKGQLLDDGDGHVTYLPYPNAFGEDGFRYRICSMACPDVCDEATVRISLDGSVAAEDCFRPNLITPDGDGLDDVFVIPCAAGWPGSSILIFNRWGSTVFESSDYQNDWSGTYNGQPLPPSTYFYQLRLNDGKGTILQGYVVVN